MNIKRLLTAILIVFATMLGVASFIAIAMLFPIFIFTMFGLMILTALTAVVYKELT